MYTGNYDKCNGCDYYFGEIDQCMFGEDDVPNDLPKKCETKSKDDKSYN